MAVLAWTLLPLLALHALFAWRWRSLLRFQLLLDLGLAAVVAPALLLGADLSPVRCVQNAPPFTAWEWSETTELQPAQSDVTLQFHPWWREARRELVAGRLSLVSERIGGGLPLLANGQTGLWAPVMLPVWVLGPERGTTVMALWKLEAAGLGAFLLLLSGFRVGWRGAAVAGLAYGLGCFQVGWLLVPLSWVTAALPWVWWGVLAALRRRARPWVPVLVGLGLGWLLGCGLHPETAAIACGSAWLAGLVLHPRRWPRVAVMAVVALPVAAVLAWPTVAAVQASAKVAQHREDAPNRRGLPLQVQLAAAQQLLVPLAHGHPARGFDAPYPYPSAATGAGGLILGLLAAGAVRRRHRRHLLAALASLAVAAVLAYRVPPLDWLLVRLPPFDRMTLPRFAALVPLALALWAGLATEGLSRGLRRGAAWRALAPLLVLTAAASAGAWALPWPDLALVAAGLGLAVVVAVAPSRTGWLAPLLACETALLAVGVNPLAAPSDRLPRPPLVAALAAAVEAEGGRVIGVGGALPPNLASGYGLSDLRAFDPVRPQAFSRLMGLLGEADPVVGGPLATAPPILLGAWSVRFLVSPPGVAAPGWEMVWSDGSGAFFRNPHWLPELRVVGKTVTPAGEEEGWGLLGAETVDLATTAVLPPGSPTADADHVGLVAVEWLPHRVRAVLLCDGPCLLVLARPWAPGWRARLDGARVPVQRANLAGLGVAVPKGEHAVELAYRAW